MRRRPEQQCAKRCSFGAYNSALDRRTAAGQLRTSVVALERDC
jgi:hypothetical protein